MSEKVIITKSSMDAIGDAIRDRNGLLTKYLPSDMPAAIEAIPNSYAAGDEGKVVSNGALVAQTARATDITENGTFDTTENNSVTVNVSGGGTEDWLNLKNYIESSGTQWIDTGYIVHDNSMFDVVYTSSSSQPSYPTLFGVRDNDSGATAGRCTFFVKHSTGAQRGSFAWGTADTNADFPSRMYLSGKKQKCVFSKGFLSVKQEDENAMAFDFVSDYSASNTRSIYICTLNQGGADYGAATHFRGKLYRFRIYEGNTLVHEFVPWQESGVTCLKDTVTGNFLYNAGTGDFVYGTDT